MNECGAGDGGGDDRIVCMRSVRKKASLGKITV
jgi:hypothetical protein